MMQIVYISATPNVITLSRRLPCFFYHCHINQHQNLHFPGLLYIFPSTEHNTFYATLSCSFFFSLSYFIFIFHFRISLSFFNFTFTFTNHIPGFCSARSKCRAAPPRLPAAHQCPSLSIIIIIPPSSVRKFSQFFFGNILFVEAMPRLGNYSVYRGQPKVTMNPKKWPRFWHLPKGSDCEWYWEGRPARNKSGVTFHPTIKPSSKTGDHYHVEVLIGIVTRRIFEYFSPTQLSHSLMEEHKATITVRITLFTIIVSMWSCGIIINLFFRWASLWESSCSAGVPFS